MEDNLSTNVDLSRLNGISENETWDSQARLDERRGRGRDIIAPAPFTLLKIACVTNSMEVPFGKSMICPRAPPILWNTVYFVCIHEQPKTPKTSIITNPSG